MASKTVWKFEIPATDRFFIDLPEGALVLHVGEQNGDPFIWVMVDPDAPKTMRFFRLYGTGQPIDDSSRHYVGTFQLRDMDLVFHLFDLGDKK